MKQFKNLKASIKKKKQPLITSALLGCMVLSFQHCQVNDGYSEIPGASRAVLEDPNLSFNEPTLTEKEDASEVQDSPEEKDKAEICKGGAEACDLTPQVTRVGVVTILLALGDLAQEKLVVTADSARLIAQNAVKFASPVIQPKILVVKDSNHQGESIEDTEYIAKVLLANYDAQMINEPKTGLEPKHLEGYDLVWFNNPGHQMGLSRTFLTLKNFNGGVVLSGDDLTQGKGFSIRDLTGLKFIDNGTDVKCGGKNYRFDNNSANKYQVSMSEQFLPGLSLEIKNFEYGNDIDNSELAFSEGLEVLAHAESSVGACNFKRPVVVRYEK